MSPRFFPTSLLCCAISLPGLTASGLAHAAEAQRFGASEIDETVRPLSQREFADAATTQIGFLTSLRAWRNTLRGSGARRDWSLAPLQNQKLSLSMGNVAPSTFGGGAGMAAKWRGLEIGSTAQPQSVDELLARFDSLLTGENAQKLRAKNPTQWNWLRAQLADSPNLKIEVLAARASRDLAESSRNWSAGDFASAGATLRLPADWSLSGDFARAAVERKNGESDTARTDAASAWGLEAAGPLAHPFGVARASAHWRGVGEGYVAPTEENGAAGVQNGGAELAQDVKIGPLSGHLNFAANTRRRDTPESARAGDQLEQNSARSAAQMRLALTPNLSLTGQGQWDTLAVTRALSDETQSSDTAAPDALDAAQGRDSQARDLSRQLVGDVGVQWNFSHALSLSASLGASSQNSRSEVGETLSLGPQSEEMRRALELRQRSGQSDFRVRFSQRARKNVPATGNLSENALAPVSQWRLEATRPLVGSVRLKTILDWASDAAKGQSARRIEAQLQIARVARFDARYRQGNLAPGLMSDEWNSVFDASNSALKQWSARFGAGSAASGAGLGLSMEIVRSQGAVPDSYRVGLQFK